MGGQLKPCGGAEGSAGLGVSRRGDDKDQDLQV